MMSQSQKLFLLFGDNSLWRQVCAKQGWQYPADDERHRIYAELHDNGNGDLAHTNFRDFTQDDFSVVKARFKAIINPDDIQGQLDCLNQKRKRMEYSCMTLAQKCSQYDWMAYIGTILCDKFGANALEDLTEAQLTMLRDTLARCANEKRAKKAVLSDKFNANSVDELTISQRHEFNAIQAQRRNAKTAKRSKPSIASSGNPF